MIQKEGIRVLSPTELTFSLDKYISVSRDANCSEEKQQSKGIKSNPGVEKVFYIPCLLVSVAQPCLTLCDPMDCSPPGSSVHGFL